MYPMLRTTGNSSYGQFVVGKVTVMGEQDLAKLRCRSGPLVLGVYRMVVGFLFACHGASTLFGIPAGPVGRVTAPIGSWPLWWAALIELVGGLSVMVGLATRTAAFMCSGAMAYAYFSVHLPKGVLPITDGGDPAVLFCWSFFLIVFSGPGALSLHALLVRRPLSAADRTIRSLTRHADDGRARTGQVTGRENPGA